MKYLSPLDVHVHLREHPGDPYFKLGLSHAWAVGLAGVMEMPNTSPPLATADAVLARRLDGLKVTPSESLYHGVHIAITSDSNQARDAIESVARGRDGLRSDKTYYVDSTGNLGVIDDDYQRWLWATKVAAGYRGVSMGHFEDYTLFTGRFDPADPVTHSHHQNESAEVLSVERQLRHAHDAGFRGTFYVCHVSSPATVELVRAYRGCRPWPPSFRVVLEATPHHLLLNTDAYARDGNRYKCNPPLRPPASQAALLDLFLAGEIDVVATDHAPHPVERKTCPRNPASGLPSIPYWPKLIERLVREFGMSQEHLDAVTFHNANRIFKLGLQPREVDVTYDPGLWAPYGYNPWGD